jgi:hypothetical protein
MYLTSKSDSDKNRQTYEKSLTPFHNVEMKYNNWGVSAMADTLLEAEKQQQQKPQGGYL